MIPKPALILLKFIREIETGRKDETAYDTVYGHNEGRLPKRLTDMTLAEVIRLGPSWTKTWRSSAAGAYQFMNGTLKDIKSRMELHGRHKFDQELQDRMGYFLLERRGYHQYMSGEISRTSFAKNLAREWASLPVLASTQGAHRKLKRGQSYYTGDALNKALVKPTEVESVLSKITDRAFEVTPTRPGFFTWLFSFLKKLFRG
jgi:muramidase (phage lysozyme)